MKKFFRGDFRVPYHPWVYFLLFFLVHVLLSSLDAPLTVRLFLLFFGLILPLVFAVLSFPPKGPSPAKALPERGFFQGIFSWPFWVLAGLLTAGFRFGGLGHSSWWYGWDEALNGMGAIALLRHWNWDLFETFGQIPTTLSRIVYGFIRLTGEPLASFQFSTAFLSTLSVAVGYWALRQYFSKPLSALAAFLLAFNYISLWSARTGYPVALFLLWEGIVLGALGWFLSSRKGAPEQWAAMVLGTVSGLGPYILTPWPPVSLFALLAAAWKTRRSRAQSPFWIFLVFFLAALTPFLVCVLQGNYGRHLMAVSAWNRFSGETQLRVAADTLDGLFRESPPEVVGWHADGFLNPLLAAFFWVGILELVRQRKINGVLALGLGFLLCLSPALLSNGYEPIRMLSILPFLLVAGALGMEALAVTLPPARRAAFLALALLVAAGTDVARYHPVRERFLLGNSTQEFKGAGWEAYELLQPYVSRANPGLIFSEMVPETTDCSLTYATYFKNAAWNRNLPLDHVLWAAVLTDSRYVPFLKDRFPGAQWLPLSSPNPGKIGRHVLGILPFTSENKPTLLVWRDFYGPFQDINWEIEDLSNGLPRSKILAELLGFYPKVPNDPFLQSCFFEKLAFNYSWEKTFHPEDTETNWSRYSGVFHASFSASYQDVVIREKFGKLLATEGKMDEAKGIFNGALKLSPGNPWLKREMKKLGLD